MQLKDMFNQENMDKMNNIIDQINPLQNNHYKTQGVSISPKKPKRNSTVKVIYTGLLAQQGAQDVFIHYGDSVQQQWDHVDDIQMQKQPSGSFITEVPIENGTHFHVSFHDNADHWDNNNGQNYSFETY